MRMKKEITALAASLYLLSFLPLAYALTTTVSEGAISDTGNNLLNTNFGMVLGSIMFRLGNFQWQPNEIWLIPSQIDPDAFSKGLTQRTVLEVPQNQTFSTCRTAVYYNETVGYGFKIYNTGTTTQVLTNGTFCGLAYNGTYYVYAKF